MVTSAFAVIGSLPGTNQTQAKGSISDSTAAATNTAAPVQKASVVTHSGPGLSTAHRILSNLNASGVPSKYVYLPNLNEKSTYVNGQLNAPGYSIAPAPMGVADYGLINKTGTMTSYSYQTSSIEGVLNLTSTSLLSMVNDAPQSFSTQLNAIMSNVTLFGSSSYTFWTQNVAFYSARTHTLEFLSNIWNFSSPSTLISPNVFSKYGGNLIAPTFYYGLSPIMNVTLPFEVQLYLNSSVSPGGNDTIFFNYTLHNKTAGGSWMTSSGMFDYAEFNSSYGQAPGYKAPLSNFLISGNQITPTGFIPYDAELMVGGPGGGSSATFTSINGYMQLKTLNATSHQYQNVKAAYNVASETGETSVGVNVYYTPNAVAHLTTGPSIIAPLWNLSSTSEQGYFTVHGTISPGSAYVFVNSGPSLNNITAAWAPVRPSGQFSYDLMPGTYSFQILMSYYDPVYFNETGTNSSTPITPSHLTMTQDFSQGMYTPLQAWSNGSLKALVKALDGSGNGTLNSPYVITGYHGQWTNVTGTPTYVPNVNINPLFWEMNDYLFPIFYGVLFANVDNYTVLTGMPSMQILFPSFTYGVLNYWQVPVFNYMGYQFYNDSNISIWNNQYISGWFSNNYNYVPVGSIIMWNSTNFLVADNTFYSMGASLMIYNPYFTDANNTIWGNRFLQSPGIAESQYSLSYIQGSSPNGIDLWSSGNLIYNNYFNVATTAMSLSPAYDPYSGAVAFYTDTWNVTKQSAANINMVNGFELYGSIIGQNYQGGNYWWDYTGNGTEPYYGAFGYYGYNIQSGADYAPLAEPMYTVVFLLSLPTPAPWSVELFNIQQQTDFGIYAPVYINSTVSGSYVSFNVPNGTYGLVAPAEIQSPAYNYVAINLLSLLGTLSFQVAGSSMTLNLTSLYFIIPTYNVTIQETGLAAGTTWGFTFPVGTVNQTGYTYTDQTVFQTNATSVTIPYAPEYLNQSVVSMNVSGYIVSPVTYSINITNSAVTLTQSYTPVAYSVHFGESGLASGTSWTVTLNGNTQSSTTSSMSFSVSPGTYTYTVGSVSGYSSAGSGSVTVNSSTSNSTTYVSIAFVSVPTSFTVTFKESGLSSGTNWTVVFDGTSHSSTSSTITLSSVSSGSHTYSFKNVSGYSTPASGSLSVNGNSNVNVAFSKTTSTTSGGVSSTALVYIIGGTVGGLVVGGVVVYALARRPKP